MRAGVVTSVSVIASTSAFPDGLRALGALAVPVSVGLHVNFTAGTPLSPASEVPSLVDRSGRFRPLAAFAARALAGRIRGDELAREMLAQLARLRAAWPDVWHLDSHQHVHALPAVARAIRGACGTLVVRRPVEPAFQPGARAR